MDVKRGLIHKVPEKWVLRTNGFNKGSTK